MPPLPAVPDVLRIQLHWSDGSDTGVDNTQYCSYSGGPPNASACATLAATVVENMASNDILWDPATVLTGATVTDLSTDTGGEGSSTANHVGTRTGGMLDGATCMLVNYGVERRYRGGKPRNYFPWGVSTDLATKQTWAGAFVSEVNAAMTSYFAAIIGSDSGGTTVTNHVNVSYYSGFTVEVSPSTGRARNVPTLRSSPLVNAILVQAASPNVASQRRRNR